MTDYSDQIREYARDYLATLGERQAEAARAAMPRIQGTRTGRIVCNPVPLNYVDVPAEVAFAPPTSGWVDVGYTDVGVTMTPVFADASVDPFVNNRVAVACTRLEPPTPEHIAYNNERDRVRLEQLAAYREVRELDRMLREDPSYRNHSLCHVCTQGPKHRAEQGVTWDRVMGLPEPWPLDRPSAVWRSFALEVLEDQRHG